jgi:hypothetical protein
VAIVEASREEPKITRLRMTHVAGGMSEVLLSIHAEPDQQGESYLFQAGSHVAKLAVRLEKTVRQSGPRVPDFGVESEPVAGVRRKFWCTHSEDTRRGRNEPGAARTDAGRGLIFWLRHLEGQGELPDRGHLYVHLEAEQIDRNA